MSPALLRWNIVLAGVLLPYVARLPGLPAHGFEWLQMYLGDDLRSALGGTLFLQAFNALGWGAVLLMGTAYVRDALVLIPALACFAYLGYHHAVLDLRSDPQSALAFAIVPIVSLRVTFVAGLVALALDRWWLRQQSR